MKCKVCSNLIDVDDELLDIDREKKVIKKELARFFDTLSYVRDAADG